MTKQTFLFSASYTLLMALADALEALRNGKFVLIYDADNREHETDFVIYSKFVTYRHIQKMRKDGGGLICVTVPPAFWKAVKLPFMTEVLKENWEKFPVLKALEPYDIPYDTKSSFSITINHRKTFTGITDIDRALTVSEFGKIIEIFYAEKNKAKITEMLAHNFRSPGHVTLLNASDGLLSTRQGHTELATALMVLAGLAPTAAICEMMGDDGYALKKSEAINYAEQNNLILLEGKEIIKAWQHESGNGNWRF